MSTKKPVQPTAPKHETASHVVAANWSGPLPPPAALAQFNEIIPNGAERIMSMVEQEQSHRIAMDRAALRAEVWDTLGGKALGAVMTLAAVAGAIYTAFIGAHWAVSVAIVGVPITALIGKFVRDKRNT
jgi:uncharacterized membrane protein